MKPTNENGYNRCQWMSTPNDYDCSKLWPTETPEMGCCAGTSQYASERCISANNMKDCNDMAACHWQEGEYADCEWNEQSTTGTPPQPGCCTLDDSQHSSSGWKDRCVEFWTEQDCTMPVDGFGQNRCSWSDHDEYFDCSLVICLSDGF